MLSEEATLPKGKPEKYFFAIVSKTTRCRIMNLEWFQKFYQGCPKRKGLPGKTAPTLLHVDIFKFGHQLMIGLGFR